MNLIPYYNKNIYEPSFFSGSWETDYDILQTITNVEQFYLSLYIFNA